MSKKLDRVIFQRTIGKSKPSNPPENSKYSNQQKLIWKIGNNQLEKSFNDFSNEELKAYLIESLEHINDFTDKEVINTLKKTSADIGRDRLIQISKFGVWKKRALQIFNEWKPEQNKSWIHYSPENIPDGAALDARFILESIQNLEQALFKGEHYNLALRAIELGHNLAVSDAFKFEYDVIIGKGYRQKQSKKAKRDRGRQNKTILSKKLWQKEADLIFKAHPAYSNSCCAEIIKQRLCLTVTPQTIRKAIKNNSKK